MTTEEFKRFRSGIAYQAIKFQKGLIDKKEMITVLRASLGEDVFEEMKDLIEKVEKEEM